MLSLLQNTPKWPKNKKTPRKSRIDIVGVERFKRPNILIYGVKRPTACANTRDGNIAPGEKQKLSR
jgi:hypothetical protein